MADKMMRIAGRGKDGLAKAINITENGELETLANGGLTSIGKVRGLTIQPNQTAVVFDKVPVKNNSFFYTIVADVEHSHTASYQWYVKDEGSPNSFSAMPTESRDFSKRWSKSRVERVLGDRIWFILTNNSNVARTYSVYVWGINSDEPGDNYKKLDNGDGTVTPVVSLSPESISEDIKSQDLIENANLNIGPGEEYYTDARFGIGSKLGVGIQIRNAGKFEIYVAYSGNNHFRNLATELIYTSEDGALTGGSTTEKITNKYLIIIKNIGTTAFELRDLTITDFK